MEQNQKNKNLKKKRLLVIIGAFAVLLLLVLLNSIDFESSPTEEAPEPPYTPDTYYAYYFVDPDYESNIFENPDYKKLDHSIAYTYNNQTVDLKNNLKNNDHESYDVPFAAFFVEYFTALAKGNANGNFDSFYSDVYFRTHKSFGNFAPQKVYDIDVARVGDPQTITSEEKEEDVIYIGCTLTSFEVRYRIFQNDGTNIVSAALVLVCAMGGTDKEVLPFLKVVGGRVPTLHTCRYVETYLASNAPRYQLVRFAKF